MAVVKNYKYKGVPLTSGIAKYLIINNLESNKPYKTKEIKEIIVGIHLEAGGMPHEGKDVQRNVIKKALSILKLNGKAVNITQGNWKFDLGDRDDNFHQEVLKKKESLEKKKQKIDAFNLIEPKRIIGDITLEGFVYFYYYPEYKKSGKETWPCKIGSSKEKDYSRVIKQVGTGIPENPILEFVIFHEKYKELEKFIHYHFF
ncbi:hypothetical protein PM10SUCC1_19390 [Propionigenium maris DSM 9537]|uniref:Uncharacterized protein n=1 Tax=Propionigenium maris DSM 9537 TaxID=1123000 RepID=A0A9W6GLN1_9FUSO|nr:hypothetical protein [Propionigenium maris]GLI56425.1 hypothetical protein PM10SUCC1_19390 [Propionigenium maris DSM 9537]